MSNDMNKKMQECQEAKFLFEHLKVSAYSEWESPDFTFVFEGKLIGLEHTRWFPNGKTIDNNAWHEIEQLIQNELDKSGLLPRLFFYTAKTHKEGKKNYTKIAEEIITGYRFMSENSINRLDESDHDGFKLERLSYLSFFPDITLEHFALSEIQGGVVSNEDLAALIETVKKKEKKLMEYRKQADNSEIQEYWLSVYIPVQEFCIAEGDRTPFTNSSYDRIYLLNGSSILTMSHDGTSIVRLK